MASWFKARQAPRRRSRRALALATRCANAAALRFAAARFGTALRFGAMPGDAAEQLEPAKQGNEGSKSEAPTRSCLTQTGTSAASGLYSGVMATLKDKRHG